MPNTIPAAGEAMPKTSRRAFLATIAAAALPVPAGASAVVTSAPTVQSELQGLIDAYVKADIEAEAAIEFENSLLDLPGRPDWPMVKAREFGRHLWPMRQQEFHYRASIEEVFDKEDATIHRWLDFFSVDDKGNPQPASAKNVAERDRRLARNEENRKVVLAIYAERQRIWDDWAGPSGYADASKRSNELDAIREELVEKVLNFKVSTADEMMLKAHFISDHYCGDRHASLSADLVKAMAEIWKEKA